MKICADCGHSYDEAYAYCSQCGSNRIKPDGVVCKSCGTVNQPENVYCCGCGKKLGEETVETAACCHCGRANPQDAVFCRYCGQKIREEDNRCICGAHNKPDAEFCYACGRKLAGGESVTVPEVKRFPFWIIAVAFCASAAVLTAIALII